MESALLLRTKLFIPPERSDVIARPRLLQRLDAATRRPLTLIAAPPGFGKTTLLSQWIHSPAQPAVAWLSLDTGDNDPIRFWNYILAALQTRHPQLALDLPGLLRSPQPPPIETLLTVLINELTEISQPFFLILDDYHTIDSSAIHQGIAFLIDHLPPPLHLILISRTDPPLPLAPWRARRQLGELHAADLRFLPEESTAFLNQIMGLGLPADAIAALEARTEGWIAGLQLAALSVQGQEDTGAFIRAFTGSHRYVLDYLAQEILDRQPENLRSFLLQTAVLDRLSGPLCQALTGRHDSQQLLEQLENGNFFLIPLDAERRWYRYHALFTDFLRSRLETLYPDLPVELHRRAADWYYHQNLLVPAINHAFTAKDFDRIAEWLTEKAGLMFYTCEIQTLCDWIEALPREIVRTNPRLSVIYAWTLLSTLQLDKVAEPLNNAQQTLGIDTAGDLPQIPFLRVARGEICTLRSVLSINAMDIPGARQLADQALRCLEGMTDQESLFNTPTDLRIVASFNRAVAAEINGEQEIAEKTFAETLRLSRARENFHLAALSFSHLAQLQTLRGALYEAAATYRESLDYIAAGPGERSPLAGPLYTGLGNLLLEWNDLEKCASYLDRGIALGQQWNNWDALFNGYLGRIRLAQAHNDPAAALATLETLKPAAAVLPPVFATSLIETLHAWIKAWLGNDAEAAVAIQRTGVTLDGPMNSFQESGYLVLARVLLAQGGSHLVEADALLERIIDFARQGNRIARIIEARILQTIVRQTSGREAAALPPLIEALNLAQPGGYIRTFANEGPRLLPLLTLAATQCDPAYIARIKEAILPADHSAEPTAAADLIEPLSDRELEVLRCIVAGDANQEIAVTLVVSLNTVKTHLKNIYAKLGVNNRTQAAARAHELHLL